MIAAMARDRVIGTGHGGIPWRLPRDSRHFREYTRGHFMLLGRKTFEEMSGWFTDQKPIVLTTQVDYEPDGAMVAHTVAEAIRIAEDAGDGELVVSGGASVYRQTLPFADELVLTLVHADVAGDVRFPDYRRESSLEEIAREEFAVDDENEFAFTIVRLRRVREDQPGGVIKR